ncbi:hypothetical protein WMY93_009609 [Mugilogobius chulae]|uniref:Uncharacterized protein n=1 Tax=Mugilogobius chulae TaxID=88201 RepID=A0AAW0PH45_9GOBI
MDIHGVGEELSWQNVSFFSDYFTSFVSALDSTMKENAALKQLVSNNSEEAKSLVFKVAFEAAMRENGQSLAHDLTSEGLNQGDDAQTKTAATDEERQRLKKELEALTHQLNQWNANVESLKPKLPKDDVEEQCARLKADIFDIQNEIDSVRESHKFIHTKLAFQHQCEQLEKERDALAKQRLEWEDKLESVKYEEALQENFKQRCVLLKEQVETMRIENETIIEAVEKHQQTGEDSAQECKNLEDEFASLAELNQILRNRFEDIESQKNKVARQENVQQRRVLLKAKVEAMRIENLTIIEAIEQHWQTDEDSTQECKNLEDEIESLAEQSQTLQDRLDEAKSQLPQKDKRYEELMLEKEQKLKKLEQLHNQITDVIVKLGREKCRTKECEAITVSCDFLQKESEKLEKHFKSLTKEYEKEKAKQEKNKKAVEHVETLRLANHVQQQEIDLLEEEFIELKAMSESYKHLHKDKAEVEAKNKQLSKRKKQLEKDLLKLRQREEEIRKVTDQTSEVRRENYGLYKEVLTLESHIGKEKLLKAHLNSLKALKQRQLKLMETISNLEVKGQKGFNNYRNQIETCVAELEKLHEENEALRSEYENSFVALKSQDILQITLKYKEKNIIKMTKLNEKTNSDIKRLNDKLEQKEEKRWERAGPSSHY